MLSILAIPFFQKKKKSTSNFDNDQEANFKEIE